MRTTTTIRAAATAGALLAVAAPAHSVELQWLGQSAVKITTDSGKVILIDPFITKNPKTPEEHKDLAKLGKVDLILVTRGHGDHVGDTAALAEMTGAKVAMNADMGHTFGTLGIVPYKQLIRFNKSGPITPLGEGITVTMVRAEHSSEVVHEGPDGKKSVHPGGEPAGYVVKLENGFTIYHAGDTGVFADMAFIKAMYDPDVDLLPIGGHFTMDPAHAAYAVKNLLKSKQVLPIHYGTFKPLKGTPAELKRTPAELKRALGDMAGRVIDIQPGESIKF
jgi:L-ascorbate metabolism protein UlaG (beta-lactamase superfamily)